MIHIEKKIQINKLFKISCLLFFLFSCKQQESKTSTFNLTEDYLNFTTNMNDGDTLFMFADLSACMSTWIESSYLYKKNGKIYTGGKIISHSHFKTPINLNEIEYPTQQNDSLCFEKLFRVLLLENTNSNSSPMLTISYKNDTVKFYTTDLINHLERIHYYVKIKEKLYPEIEMYQPVTIPTESE
jgi:hypothetical protein